MWKWSLRVLDQKRRNIVSDWAKFLLWVYLLVILDAGWQLRLLEVVLFAEVVSARN